MQHCILIWCIVTGQSGPFLRLHQMKLPKARRITNRAEFSRVRSSGKSVTGRFMVMGYLKDEQLTESFKLGLITTKKVGNAVVRNRIRRRLRAIFQREGERVVPGHWIVLIARKSAANATSAQLEKEWKWMLNKVGIHQAQTEISS